MTSSSEAVSRRRITEKVFTGFTERRDLPDGCALRYPRSEPWTDRLAEFTSLWRQSCPYMTFDVVPDASEGAVWLWIRGPKGTRDFVDGAHQILTSHIDPAPSVARAITRRVAALTRRLRLLPDFLIIGAKKCGTTSLYAYLTEHPSVAPALKKEIHFFDTHFHEGPPWYRSFFPTSWTRRRTARRTGSFMTGEATPDYLAHPEVPQRVYETLAGVRLIALLRDPVDRAYSNYQHQLRAGLETLPFEQVFRREASENPESGKSQGWYVGPGLYADQLERWLRFFPRDRLLVLSTEELDRHPQDTFRRVRDFLGLPDWEPRLYRRLNALPYPAMDRGARRRLARYFAPHNERLWRLLGMRMDWCD